MLQRDNEVSIKYTLKLIDGTEVAGNLESGPYLYTPGRDELMPELEELLRGLAVGDRRELRLSHETSRGMKSGVARLAMLLGYPGESFVFNVEVVDIVPRSELAGATLEPVPGLGARPTDDPS